MSNITVGRGTENKPQLARREPWDPFRAMRDLMRWDPFGESALSPLVERAEFVPAFEIKETKDAYEFRADTPGVEAKDLEVKLTDHRLTISGKREAEKSDKGDTYYTYERSYGSFTRSFNVPDGVNGDAIQADLKNGVLTVVLPKKSETKPRSVQIKTG